MKETYTIEHAGKKFANATIDELKAAGVPDAVIDQAVAEEEAAKVTRHIRGAIRRDVGDVESLLGTTADGAALALYGVAVIIQILAAHGSADAKDAVATAADGQLQPLAENFLAGLEDGSIVLPALVKGLPAVVEEIGGRSTGVASVLATAKPQG